MKVGELKTLLLRPGLLFWGFSSWIGFGFDAIWSLEMELEGWDLGKRDRNLV